MRFFVALAISAACITVPAAPATAGNIADNAPTRIENSSDYDSAPLKFARAVCPHGQVAFGMGGQIDDGFGGVALTGIVPDEDLGAVTAWGRALPGHSTAWSVTAVVVCRLSMGPVGPVRIAGQPGQYVAQARCPFPRILYSLGYQIQRPTGGAFLREATSSADLRDVTVRAGGPAVDPESLVAYGICAAPMARFALTQADPSALDGSSPKDATAGRPKDYFHDYGSWMFGAGATVKGAPGVFIDALVPASNLDGAYARAYKANLGTAAVMGDGGDDWELSVDGDYVGEWY